MLGARRAGLILLRSHTLRAGPSACGPGGAATRSSLARSEPRRQVYPSGWRWFSTSEERDRKEAQGNPNSGGAMSDTSETNKKPSEPDADASPSENPGAIGGFMRGLMGGRDVAAEDAFVAEAKEQGIDLPPPPPHRRADLVPVKRRKRRDEDEEESQSIRDRLFSRFAGSPFMQGAFEAKDRIAERIDESDNPVINFFRNIYDRIFAENEMAMVVREIREEDKSFTVSEFLREVETVLIPDILGAYLAGERERLEEFCTEDACRMLNASIREREAEGIVMDTNVLDISDVELTAGRLLEDAPVLIVTFSAQQINCLRDRTGAVIEGAVDDIRAVYYVFAFVREVELEEAAPSGGGMGSSESGSESGEEQSEQDSSNTTENASSGENGAKTGPGEEKADIPRWKLLEMVIRGAHATI